MEKGYAVIRLCVEALRHVKINDFFAVVCFCMLLSKLCAYAEMRLSRFDCIPRHIAPDTTTATTKIFFQIYSEIFLKNEKKNLNIIWKMFENSVLRTDLF